MEDASAKEQAESNLRPHWHELERDGTYLACADYGGTGTPVMLLHGLAGHATEWNQTASWLTKNHRVMAPDLRGHGQSDRHPYDSSRTAHVEDVAAWIQHFSLGPVTLVGQSLGGHTAFLLAARHPHLVRKLVVAEADPGTPEKHQARSEDDETVTRVKRWLEDWPTPFPSRSAAIAFFDRNDNWARAWADGLEQRAEGLYPRFDVKVMIDTLEAAAGSFWDEWRSIKCPILLVVAKDIEDPELTHRMVTEQQHALLIEIPDAGHDLHLDNPAAWRKALETFLS